MFIVSKENYLVQKKIKPLIKSCVSKHLIQKFFIRKQAIKILYTNTKIVGVKNDV